MISGVGVSLCGPCRALKARCPPLCPASLPVRAPYHLSKLLEVASASPAGLDASTSLGRGIIRLETLIESSNFSIRVFRALISQFELFELILLLKFDAQFPVE